ncbi:MAG: NAD(P)/FAD-dependent oxidoreductase [Methanobrevibacter sp.]
MKYDIAIIGGGPSGILAGIKAANYNPNIRIAIIEKNSKLGKKLCITGQGRCNITNNTPIRETLKKYSKKDSKFIKHAFYSLKNDELLDIFRNKGLEFKVEDNGRVFPITDSAESVVDVLEEYISDLNIDLKLNNKVLDVLNDGDEFLIKTDKSNFTSKKLIISTGGITYPYTGSTGDGYKFAKNLGHSIETIKPGLFPFIVNDSNLTSLSGLSFRNIGVSFKYGNKTIEEKGDLLISNTGITGPVIINISREFIKLEDYDLLNNKKNFNKEVIFLDFIPSLNREEIKDDFIKNSKTKKEVHNYLRKYLPNKFTFYFLDKLDINLDTKMNNLNKSNRNKIVENLKSFPIEIDGIIDKAGFVTVGGISLNEINPKNMESKLIPGLYFSGEILDICGPTGGYNLQMAFTTGSLAGESASKSII